MQITTSTDQNAGIPSHTIQPGAEPPVEGAATGSAKRDGNWIDEWGACKVCDGEIPHGHTDNCDICKLEREISRLRRALEVIAGTAYNNCSHQTMRDAAIQALSLNVPDGLAGQSLGVAPCSAKITQRQLESILINEGIIQAASIEDPDGYDGGKTALAMTIATQQINKLISPNDQAHPTAAGGTGGAQKGL